MSIVDTERANNLYNAEAYKDHTNNWEDEVSYYRAKALSEALKNSGLDMTIESILDVGCGSGGVLAHLANDEKMSQVSLTGIDISRVAIDISNSFAKKKRISTRVSYKVNSVTEVNGRNSLISLIHVLEHCPDMLEMLNECAAKSDFQYINVPLEYNLFYCLRNDIPRKQYIKYGHLHFFDESFFVAWLDQNGFDVISKVYSQDFMIKKPGIGYNTFKLIRKYSLKFFGPLITIRLFAGLSGGYLISKRN